ANLQATAGSSPVIYGNTIDRVAFYPAGFARGGGDVPIEPPPPPECNGTESTIPIGGSPPPPQVPYVPPRPHVPPPKLTSLGPDRIVLRVGTSKRVRYRLTLPPAPTPLDVDFLVDTTGSMGGAICGVRQGLEEIVRDLVSHRIDAHFGVGDYR